MEITILIQTMQKLLLFVLLGYVLRSRQMLTHTGVKELSSLAVNITCPLLVIASVCRMKTADMSIVLLFLGVGTIIYAFLPFFARICTAILHVQKSEGGAYQFMFIFSNTSLLGFPIVQALFGNDAVFYTAILHMPFDVLVYSYGIYLMHQGDEQNNFSCHSLCNAGLILTIFALIIYLAQLQLPKLIVDATYTMGNITTPISMLIIGASLREVRITDIFREQRLYIMSVIRLIILPLIIYVLLINFTHFDKILIGIATIAFGMPVGSMIVMLANEFDNNIELAAKSVSLTTAAALVTIPLLSMLIK